MRISPTRFLAITAVCALTSGAFATASFAEESPKVDPEATINWEADFPDTAFRSLVQAPFNSSKIDTYKYKDLKRVSSIDADRLADARELKDIKGIELLSELNFLELKGTSVTSLDLSDNPKVVHLKLEGSALCAPYNIVYRGVPQQYDPQECGRAFSIATPTEFTVPALGSYIIDGSRRKFSGFFNGTFFNISPDSRDYLRPLMWKRTENALNFSFLVADKFERTEERTYDSNGTIRSEVTVRNVSNTPLNTHIVERSNFSPFDGAVTEKAGDNAFYGLGDYFDSSFTYISIPNAAVYSGHVNPQHGQRFLELVKDGHLHPTSSLEKGAKFGGSTILALEPRILQPGETISYTYQTTLRVKEQTANVRIDYMDSTTLIKSITREGPLGTNLDLTTLPEVPAGYELDPVHSVPQAVAFGQDGALTIVKIFMRKPLVEQPKPPVEQPKPQLPPQSDDSSGPDKGSTPSGPTTVVPPASTSDKQSSTTDKSPTQQTTPGTDTNPKTPQAGKSLARTGLEGGLIVLASALAVAGTVLSIKRRK